MFGTKLGKTKPKYLLVKAGEIDNPVKGEQAQKMYRIRALRDIPVHGVKKGDWGGYVQEVNTLSHEGACWVGGEAQAIYNVRITGNALIDGYAIVDGEPGCVINVSDNVRVTGNAQVLARKKEISSEDIRELFCLNENFIAQDLAYICNLTLGSGNAVVAGHSQVRGAREISGTSLVTERAVVKRGAIIKGESLVAGDAIVEKNSLLSDKKLGVSTPIRTLPKSKVKTSDNVDLAKESHKKEITETVLDVFHEVMSSINSYQEDIVKIIKFPVMTDRTDPFTLNLAKAINKANRLVSSAGTKEFEDAVDKLEDAFLKAESNAIKLSTTTLNEAERKKTALAKDLIKVASNEGATENEKKVAFAQVFKTLEGVVTIPENAVDSFRMQLGLKEIEA